MSSSAPADRPAGRVATTTTAGNGSGHVADHGHSHLGLALLVIGAAQLMVVLDASIVNIALPHIQSALDFTPSNLTWVINGYTLAFGGLLLLGGRAGDLFGRRRVFIAGIALFTIASFLCGVAQNEAMLIGFRVLQGAGAAIASPTALALITTTFPEGKPRNRAFAVYAAMSGAGAAVGLIAGGVLTNSWGWRWVFFVNVPIGILIAFVAPRVLGESKPEPGKIDFSGALIGTLGLTSLVYGIVRAGNPDLGWTNSVTLICFAIAALMLALFVGIESRHPHPIMPLPLFRNRNRTASYAIMLVVGAAMFSMFYFISLFVQQILGYSALKAGVAFLPFTVGVVLGAGVASQLAQRLAPRVIASTGLVLASIGLLLYTRLDVDSTYASSLLPAMLVMSVGMGLIFVPLTLTAVSNVRNEESGIASAILNTMQQVGGTLGLAVLATIAVNATTARFPEAGAINAAKQAADAGVPGVTAPDPAALQRAAEAVTHGYTVAFGVGLVLFLVALVMTVTLVNAPKQQADAANPVHVG
jgi:EmrB/QacA subfamily drug resistance transporter